MKQIPYKPGRPQPSANCCKYELRLDHPRRYVAVSAQGKTVKDLEFTVTMRRCTRKGETVLKFGCSYAGFAAMGKCAYLASAAWEQKIKVAK